MWLQSILCTNTHPLLTSMQTFKTQIGELISTMAEVVVCVSIPVTMVHLPLLHVRYVLNQVILLDSVITGLIFLIRISAILDQPQAIIVARYHTTDNEWHLDTRATHHLTNNANNIHLLNEDDNSQDHIQVANGAGLKIIHSCTSTFSSPSKSFMLKQIMCSRNTKKFSICSSFFSRQ